MHDCKKIIQKIMELIDGELDKKEEYSYFVEISKCANCLEHYQIEQAFKKLVKEKLSRKPISQELIENIKQSVQNKIKAE